MISDVQLAQVNSLIVSSLGITTLNVFVHRLQSFCCWTTAPAGLPATPVQSLNLDLKMIFAKKYISELWFQPCIPYKKKKKS